MNLYAIVRALQKAQINILGHYFSTVSYLHHWQQMLRFMKAKELMKELLPVNGAERHSSAFRGVITHKE